MVGVLLGGESCKEEVVPVNPEPDFEVVCSPK
jgi:hypothetical protein